jgi:cobalamin-dependent methionine synthase I
MAMNGKLNILAEKINDSVPSTHVLFEQGKIDEIVNLAKEQAEQGARYIDVNIGPRDPRLMVELIKAIQDHITLPLSIDTPSYEIAELALKAYDPAKAGGEKPILNSIGPKRLRMFDLLQIQPCKVIMIVNEKEDDGKAVVCTEAVHVVEAAQQMYTHAQKHNLSNDDIIFDPSIAPISTDMKGLTRMTVNAVAAIGSTPLFKGCHMSVGLSNFTVMMPSKTKSGQLVKTPLENAFLSLTVPKGLDYIVGSTKKKYDFLPEDHLAMQTVYKVLSLTGIEAVKAVRQFYNS